MDMKSGENNTTLYRVCDINAVLQFITLISSQSMLYKDRQVIYGISGFGRN